MAGGSANTGDGSDHLVTPQHRVLDILSFCVVIYKVPKVVSGIILIVYLILNYDLVRSHYKSTLLVENIYRVLYVAVLFSFNLNNFKIGEFIIICKLFGIHRYKSVLLSVFLNLFFEVLFKYLLNYSIMHRNYNFYLFKFLNLNLLFEFRYLSSINLLIYYLSTYFIMMIEISTILEEDSISNASNGNNGVLNNPNSQTSTSSLNSINGSNATASINNGFNINDNNAISTSNNFGNSSSSITHNSTNAQCHSNGNSVGHPSSKSTNTTGNDVKENEQNTFEISDGGECIGNMQSSINDQDDAGSLVFNNHVNNFIIDNQLVFKVDEEISNSKFNQYVVHEDIDNQSHSSSFPLNSDVKEFLYSNKLTSSFSTILFNLSSYYNLSVNSKNKNFRNRFIQPFYSIISALYVTRSQKNLFNGESSIAEYSESSLISYDDKIKILPVRSFINYIGDTSLSFNIVKLLQFNNNNIIEDNNYKIGQINIKVNNIDWNYHNYDNNLIILIGLTPLHNYNIKVYINNCLINNYLVSTSNEDFQTFNVQSPLSTLEDSKNFSVKMVELEKYVLKKLRRNHSKSLNELQKEIEILKNKVTELNNKEEKTWQKKNFLNQELSSLNNDLSAKNKDLSNLNSKFNTFKESRYETFLKDYKKQKNDIESSVIFPYNEEIDHFTKQEQQLSDELNNLEVKNKKLRKKSHLRKIDWDKINDELQTVTAEVIDKIHKDREDRKLKRDKLLEDSNDEYHRLVKLKNDNIERSKELEKQDRDYDTERNTLDNENVNSVREDADENFEK